MPEIIQNLPVVMIPFAILAFFYYQSNLKWMAERREIAEAILAERREMVAGRDAMLNRIFESQERRGERDERMMTAIEKSTNENHAMRNRLQEHMSRDEAFRIRSERIYLMLERHFGMKAPGDTDG